MSVHTQGKSYDNWLNGHKRGYALIIYQILPTYSLRQCIELSLENLFVDVKTYVLSAHVEYSVESYFSKTNAGDTAGDR